jgi:hypothetical protein
MNADFQDKKWMVKDEGSLSLNFLLLKKEVLWSFLNVDFSALICAP